MPANSNLISLLLTEIDRERKAKNGARRCFCFRDERNRKARESYHKRKEALNTPIEWHEEYEMSEYEKIRERNIK